MDLMEPPDDAFHRSSSRGGIWLWQVAPSIVVGRTLGMTDDVIARAHAEYFDPILQVGRRVRVFHDFFDAVGATREARDYLIDYTRKHIEQLESIHMLLGSSSFAALGAGVFTLALGGDLVQSYSDRGAMLDALERATRESEHGLH
jgi:hypothetical protein